MGKCPERHVEAPERSTLGRRQFGIAHSFERAAELIFFCSYRCIYRQRMRAPILLTTSVPEVLRAQTANENRCIDGAFGSRADRDVIVWCRPGHASLPARVQGPPSVRAVWHGAENYLIGRRTLCVDEDSYLVINGGREYSVVGQRRDTAESLTIFFSSETRRAYETRSCDRE